MSEKKKDFTYKPGFGVVVICENENEQREIYEKLAAQGLKLKVVCV